MLKSIRLKLAVPAMLLWLSLYALFNFYWIPDFMQDQKQQFLNQQETQVHLLLDNINFSLETGDLANAYASIENALALNQSWLSLEITGQHEQLIYPLEKIETASSKSITINHNYSDETSNNHHQSYHTSLETDPTQFLERQEILINELHLLFIVTFFLAVTTGLILEERIIRQPIKKLLDATKSLKDQDFSASLPQASNDEIGILIKEFSLMRESIDTYHNELMQARDKAMESTRIKTEFLSNMTHELRTPLHGIMGFTQLMQTSLANNENIDLEDVNFIYESSKDLLSLIEDVLILSRINHGINESQIMDFNCHELINSIINQQQNIIFSNNNKLITHLSENEYILRSNGEKLKKIVSELLENANKFMTDGEIILTEKLEFFDNKEFLTISIADNGPGISSNDLKNIFEPFSQGDNSMTRQHNGAGIGLSICQQYAEELSGKITVISKPGIGSTFTLHIPRDITVQ